VRRPFSPSSSPYQPSASGRDRDSAASKPHYLSPFTASALAPPCALATGRAFLRCPGRNFPEFPNEVTPSPLHVQHWPRLLYRVLHTIQQVVCVVKSTDTHTQHTHTQGSSGLDAARAELGFSFSVAGLIFPYHLGVIAELKEAGILTPRTPLGGSSGGALAAAFTALGLEDDTVLDATYRVCDAIRYSRKSSRGRLGGLLKQELARVLPDDAHERLNAWEGGVKIGVTLLRPFPTPVYIEKFKSKEDVLEVLSASCHIPFWGSNWPFTRCRGTLGADGFLTNTQTFGCPQTSAIHTVCVCPFLASAVFPRSTGEGGNEAGGVGLAWKSETPLKELSDLLHLSGGPRTGLRIISPELLKREGRGRPQELLRVALEPPADNAYFTQLVREGRRDTREWIRLAQR
jgi:hypothetical protein